MNEWIEKKLVDVAEIIMGQSPDGRFYNSDNDGMVFLQGCAEFGKTHPNSSVFTSQIRKIAPKGSILFSVRAPVGKTNLADQKYCIGRGLSAITGREVDNKFLGFSLLLKQQTGGFESQGSTFDSINFNQLSKLKIQFPRNPKEQTQIAAILTTIDEAIEKTAHLIAKYERVKTGLMQDLLTRGIDEKGQMRTEGGHEFKDSPLGRIPKEWAVEPVSNQTISSAYGPRFSGDSYDTHGNILALRTTDLDIEGNVDWENVPLASLEESEFQRHFLMKGDFVISRSGTIGITSIFESADLPVLAGAFMIRFRFKETLSPYFIKHYFTWNEGKKRVLEIAEGGVLKNLRGSSFLKLLIPIPPKEEQDRIMLVIQKHLDLVKTEKSNLKKLFTTKTALMQDLLTGKVRVTALLNE